MGKNFRERTTVSHSAATKIKPHVKREDCRNKAKNNNNKKTKPFRFRFEALLFGLNAIRLFV